MGRELAGRLGIRHLETDGLVHGPGWTETPDAELRAAIEPDTALRRLGRRLRLPAQAGDARARERRHGRVARPAAARVPAAAVGTDTAEDQEPRGALERQSRELAGGVLGLGLALRLRGAQARAASDARCRSCSPGRSSPTSRSCGCGRRPRWRRGWKASVRGPRLAGCDARLSTPEPPRPGPIRAWPHGFACVDPATPVSTRTRWRARTMHKDADQRRHRGLTPGSTPAARPRRAPRR